MGGVAVRNLLPKGSQDRHDIRTDASVQGFVSKLEVEDLANDEYFAEVTPQGNRAVAKVVHHLLCHQWKSAKRCMHCSTLKGKMAGAPVEGRNMGLRIPTVLS